MEIILAIVMGLAFGALFERYQFCMNSAITHVFLFGGTHKLKGSLIAVLASTVLFNLLITLGLVGTGAMPLLPTTIFSGVLFGIGMNLAGGCVSGTLYKMGQGYLASWIAFLGMVSGFGAVELTLARTLDFAVMRWQGATLPMTLGVDPFMFAVLVIAVALVGYWVWGRRKVSPETGQTHTLMDWSSPLTGAILIAILNTIYFVIFSHILGLVGLMSVPFLGGPFLSASVTGRFRLRRPARRQAVSSLIGGFLMGTSSSAMMGCNVTHILGGVPQFGIGSLVATVGIVLGAWLGAKLVLRIA
jgi:uncharacterized membrane protein YedE/YeeE